MYDQPFPQSNRDTSASQEPDTSTSGTQEAWQDGTDGRMSHRTRAGRTRNTHVDNLAIVPVRRSTARRNYHEHDALANSRSNYRRTSNRYVSRKHRLRRWIIGIAIGLGSLLVLGGIALGVGRWMGLFKFAGESTDDDTTLISLTNHGDEALLPVVNVDTLISGVNGLDSAEGDLLVFSTGTEDYAISDVSRQALAAALAQAQAALPASRTTEERTSEEEQNTTEGATEQGSTEASAAEGEAAETAAEIEAEAEDDAIPRTVSFIAMDLEDGTGVAYNLDAAHYNAQAIKALYATYLSSQFLDTAKASEATEGELMKTALNDDGTAGSSAYTTLRANYDEQGWDAWIGGVGAKDCIASEGYYPVSSVRSQARAWLNVYRYLTGSTAYASWFAALLENRSSSLTNDALTSTHTITQEGEEGAEPATITISPLATSAIVWSYAGALADYTTNQYTIVEHAIVFAGEKSYLISVMAGLPDTAQNRAVIENLIAALGQAVIEIPAPETEANGEEASTEAQGEESTAGEGEEQAAA